MLSAIRALKRKRRQTGVRRKAVIPARSLFERSGVFVMPGKTEAVAVRRSADSLRRKRDGQDRLAP